MTITWLDTPNKTLDTSDEPLDFLTQRDVSFVSVSYTPRPGDKTKYRAEEIAFRDGVFVWPFLRSTRVGNVFSLVRQGGWPGDPVPHVEEEPAPAVGGQELGAIYSIDFTTLPAQASFAQGAITVDGLTWYAKGALTGLPNGTTMENDLTAGQGIRFRNATSTGIAMSTGAVSYPYRHLTLPLANVPGYNALAPLLVRFRGVQTGWGGNNMGLVCGLVNTTNDGIALAAADRQYDALVATYESTREFKHGTGGLSSSGTSFPGAIFDDRGAGLYRVLGDTSLEIQDPSSWGGSFSAPSNVLLQTGIPAFSPGTRPNPHIFFSIRGQVNTGSVYFTHLQVLQPKVAL